MGMGRSNRRTSNVAIPICALGALSESLFYTALAPLLTQLDDALGFGHEQAGLLVAGYAIGYWLGTYPASWLSAHLGPRTTGVLGVSCVALATLGFALGDSFKTLLGARLLVGVGSVIAYTGLLAMAAALADASEQGLAIGTVYSGSAAGSAVGPLVGSLAVTLGRGPVFCALAAAQAIVAALCWQLPRVPNTKHLSMGEMGRYFRSARVRTALWITSVPGYALGVLTLSGTYRLDEIGASATAIAIAFSGIAVINVVLAPRIGQASDRIGRRRPLMLALSVSAIAILLMLGATLKIPTVVLIAIAGAFMLAVAGPGLALVGDGVRELRGDPAHATVLMNLCWGPAAALGAITAGMVHGARGAGLSLLLLAFVAAVSLIPVHRLEEQP
ncbi:MAG: hypothetical protein RLZZ624_488 [Cyanobacteriota bacterium]